MSPYEIEIILHHHCSGVPFPRANAPAYYPAIDRLISIGVLAADDKSITSTPLGAALVDMWCATPLPVQKFVDPRFAALSEEVK
jgi:hypothetical protein